MWLDRGAWGICEWHGGVTEHPFANLSADRERGEDDVAAPKPRGDSGSRHQVIERAQRVYMDGPQ